MRVRMACFWRVDRCEFWRHCMRPGTRWCIRVHLPKPLPVNARSSGRATRNFVSIEALMSCHGCQFWVSRKLIDGPRLATWESGMEFLGSLLASCTSFRLTCAISDNRILEVDTVYCVLDWPVNERLLRGALS